jgi:xylan 1,4-beta-xylosidase
MRKFLCTTVLGLMAFSALTLAAQTSAPRVIHADMNAVSGPRSTAYNFCVGADHGGMLLREANQQQLALARQELGFRYIRFHGIFLDDLEAYKEVDGKPVYNWTKIDTVYDVIRKAGMKPFIELGFMPNDLASGKQTIFYWKGNVTQPKDYKKWGDFIEAFARHLQQRYGDAEVATWYFEVWNEPNLNKNGFFVGEQSDYFHLYDVSAEAIKRVNPAYRVGGPSTAGAAWVPDLIAHAANNKVPLDFVSTHTYGVDGGFLDEKGQSDQKLSGSPDAVVGDMRNVRAQVAASAMPKLPVHFTEWNTSYSPGDPVHDTYINASFILDKIKRAEGVVDSLSYWTYTDLFEEAGPQPEPFHGGFGLLNREGIRKPTYFAYKFLYDLRPTELVNSDKNSWLTRDESGNFSALIWDFTAPKQDKSDGPYYRQLHPSTPIAPVKLTVAGLAPGKSYAMHLTRVGYKSNDAYSRYIEWGLPGKLSDEQLKELKSLAAGEPAVSSQTAASDGSLTVELPMNSNDIVFVEIEQPK